MGRRISRRMKRRPVGGGVSTVRAVDGTGARVRRSSAMSQLSLVNRREAGRRRCWSGAGVVALLGGDGGASTRETVERHRRQTGRARRQRRPRRRHRRTTDRPGRLTHTHTHTHTQHIHCRISRLYRYNNKLYFLTVNIVTIFTVKK